MIVDSAHTHAGASSLQEDFTKSGSLATNMTVRAIHIPRMPYLIGTDINIDPLDSEVLSLAITNDVLYDLPCDWFPGRAPPPTYHKENVHEGMTGGTRIDSVFANYAASYSCTKLWYARRAHRLQPML